MKTLFEKIIDRELPADIVFENERIIAIKDKFPKAPVHLLIITKKLIPSLQEMQPDDYPLLGECVAVAQNLAQQFDLVSKGYRLLANHGTYGGQTIYHLHFHLLGGRQLGAMG